MTYILLEKEFRSACKVCSRVAIVVFGLSFGASFPANACSSLDSSLVCKAQNLKREQDELKNSQELLRQDLRTISEQISQIQSTISQLQSEVAQIRSIVVQLQSQYGQLNNSTVKKGGVYSLNFVYPHERWYLRHRNGNIIATVPDNIKEDFKFRLVDPLN